MTFRLRPYQEEDLGKIRDAMHAGVHSILYTAPTGSGKTALTAEMLRRAAHKGMTAWFIVHRRELVKQSIAAFRLAGVPHGVVAAGFLPNRRPLVQIASIDTLRRRLAYLREPRLVIWDEAHHTAAGGWAKVRGCYSSAFHIGLTATPERLDGKGLGRFFEKLIVGPSVSWLIQNGFLSDYRIYAPSTLNLSGVHMRAGDFARDEVAAAVSKSTITGDAIAHYLRLAQGKRALAFHASVKASHEFVEQATAAGVRAAHVDAETDPYLRDKRMEQLRAGGLDILSNVDLFGEGVDVPAVEAVILLRPTWSLALYLQQIGRGLRPCAGKEHTIILDHVGNCARHGLPDEERYWSLEGREERKREAADGYRVRLCPRCFAAQVPGKPACAYCGHVFLVDSRVIEQVEGTLEEVNQEAFRRQREADTTPRDPSTFNGLVAIAKDKRMKNPYWWAKKIMDGRQRAKLLGRKA